MEFIPKVTSITYVKDGENYIEQCIRSVMEQTLKEIEIIVVDGGSSDETLNILNRLRKEDNRIRLLEIQGSVGAQFNVALDIAKGEYIAVCEGDDFIASDKYEKQYRIANENNLDVLRACYELYFDFMGEPHMYKVGVAPKKQSYDRLIINKKDFFLKTFVNGFWNGLYSRRFLIKNNIKMNETSGAAYQDITFSFLTQVYAEKIWFMSDSFHYYRIDNPNASVNSIKCIEKLGTEYSILEDILKKRGLWEKYSYMFLIWEITSYMNFMDRFSHFEKKSMLEKIYKTLNSRNISYKFNQSELSHRMKKVIKALSVSSEKFYMSMTNRDEQISNMLNFFKSDTFDKQKDVVLFGAGHFGEIIYDYLTMRGKNIIMVDNSKKVQLKGFKNNKVFSSDVCTSCDCPIVISNVFFAKEIYRQLISLGINPDKIVVCDNEDLFFREVYVGFGLYSKKKLW